MWIQTACNALKAGKVLEVQYDGYFRCVEVHAVGYSKEGNPLMRVWQVSGGSVSNEPIGWKMLRIDETQGVAISNDKSLAPRPGYRRDDRQIDQMVCQL